MHDVQPASPLQPQDTIHSSNTFASSIYLLSVTAVLCFKNYSEEYDPHEHCSQSLQSCTRNIKPIMTQIILKSNCRRYGTCQLLTFPPLPTWSLMKSESAMEGPVEDLKGELQPRSLTLWPLGTVEKMNRKEKGRRCYETKSLKLEGVRAMNGKDSLSIPSLPRH